MVDQSQKVEKLFMGGRAVELAESITQLRGGRRAPIPKAPVAILGAAAVTGAYLFHGLLNG